MPKFRSTLIANHRVKLTVKGVPGALAEIAIRGGKTLPQSFFKRVCKRNAVGNLELRTALRLLGWVPERENFPMTITAPTLDWRTAPAWGEHRHRILSGETPTAEVVRGRNRFSLYNSLQVVPYEKG